LRTDDQVDKRLALHDLGTFGLRHAARHTDFQIGVRDFQPLHPAQFGIDFFSGFFADVTCVQQDHVGIFGRLCLHITVPAQRLGHAFAVVDIHLTTIGLDKQLFGGGHCGHHV